MPSVSINFLVCVAIVGGSLTGAPAEAGEQQRRYLTHKRPATLNSGKGELKMRSLQSRMSDRQRALETVKNIREAQEEARRQVLKNSCPTC